MYPSFQREMKMMMMMMRMKLALQESMKRKVMKMMEVQIWGKVKRRRKSDFHT